MVDVLALERERVGTQQRLDDAKTQGERNRLGQFATPPSLAEDVLVAALSMLGNERPIRFLDPAFGTGAFYSALLRCSHGRHIEAAEGVEIDPHYGLAAVELWRATGLRLRLADFTALASPGADSARFNLVVCNPPYVRHHHIAGDVKQRLRWGTEQASGMRLSGLAGLYCHFVGLSHAWMQAGGVAAWLIPSEFMNVNYGGELREYLLQQVALTRIHRFDPNHVQFDDALVSSAVVFFRNSRPRSEDTIRFTLGGTLEAPETDRDVAASELLKEVKWTHFPARGARLQRTRHRLGDLFEIKRGIATGANNFFILTEEEARARGLPDAFLRPILPNPRHVPTDLIAADKQGRPLLEKRLLLFDCRLPPGLVRRKYPRVWEYLEAGRDEVARRYLCSSRQEWYFQEERPAAPMLCTYLGRSDSQSRRPFRFLLNRSQATAHNVYLLLYPRARLQDAISARPDLLRRIWEGLNSLPPEELLGEGRVYGGGLHKIEPKELGNVDAGWIVDLAPDLLEADASVQLRLWEQRGDDRATRPSVRSTLASSVLPTADDNALRSTVVPGVGQGRRRGASGICPGTLPDDPRHWICPINAIGAVQGTEVVSRLVRGAGLFAFPPGARAAGQIAPGDKLCFYVAGTGVVGHAVVSSKLPQGATGTEELLKGLTSPVALAAASMYLDHPIVITREQRERLEAFQQVSELGRERWAWFVHSVHVISASDFTRLTCVSEAKPARARRSAS